MIQFRRATEADLPVIAQLAHQIWWAHYPEIIGETQVTYMLDKLYSEQALLAQMQGGQTFWLPEADGKLLGYLSVSEKEPGHFFLHKFYLDNHLRGKGWGRQVFEELLALYPGLQDIRLTVNRQNFKSINFYFKIGFIIESCLDLDIGDGYFMNDFQMLYRRQ